MKPADGLVLASVRGIRIWSRYGHAADLATFTRIINALPEGMRFAITGLWCDSKCQNFFVAELRRGHDTRDVAQPIAYQRNPRGGRWPQWHQSWRDWLRGRHLERSGRGRRAAPLIQQSTSNLTAPIANLQRHGSTPVITEAL